MDRRGEVVPSSKKHENDEVLFQLGHSRTRPCPRVRRFEPFSGAVRQLNQTKSEDCLLAILHIVHHVLYIIRRECHSFARRALVEDFGRYGRTVAGSLTSTRVRGTIDVRIIFLNITINIHVAIFSTIFHRISTKAYLVLVAIPSPAEETSVIN
jgi:hypothetical protein